MQFKVREGFVIHIMSYGDDGADWKLGERTTKRGGSVVELDEKEALSRLHALEPADKEAAAWLESKARPRAPQAV